VGKFAQNKRQHLTNFQCSCKIEVCCFNVSVDCLLKESGVYDLLSKYRSLLVGHTMTT
jgi:hypothetical protein